MEDGGQDERLNFIPCLTWVKRGVAKEEPDKVSFVSRDLYATLISSVVLLCSLFSLSQALLLFHKSSSILR